jgi:putative DNA primase/helicase
MQAMTDAASATIAAGPLPPPSIADALPGLGDPPSPVEAPRLRRLDLAELLALTIAPRGMLLDPVIPEHGMTMLYAARGVGKTHVALGIAHAVACGSSFLTWRAPQPRRVLLVDGEMPAVTLRERLAAIVGGSGVAPAAGMLGILAGDLLVGGIGNLAAPAEQAELETQLAGVELLILDNLSSLTYVAREDYSGWAPIQQWLLRLRRRGISTLVVHHAGKDGEQRGTTRREDLLDTTINLLRPNGYVEREGARFEVHVEKRRGLLGEEARPFEARLETRNGAARWTVQELINVVGPRVADLINTGLSIRDIAAETGLSKSAVHRLKATMLARMAERARERRGE